MCAVSDRKQFDRSQEYVKTFAVDTIVSIMYITEMRLFGSSVLHLHCGNLLAGWQACGVW